MNELTIIAAVTGGILTVFNVLPALAPERAQSWFKAFPRHVLCGRVLAAAALAWAGWLLYHTPLGALERYRPLVYLLTPTAYVLVIVFVDDLLAPRALGGLMLLAPEPILAAARFHPSPFRVVMLVLAYVLVVGGMALVLSPYLFRKAAERLFGTRLGCRLWGGLGLGLGLLIVLLGLAVY